MSSKNLRDVQRAFLKSDEELNTYLENVGVGDLRDAFKELQATAEVLSEGLDFLGCLEDAGVDNWSGYEAAEEMMDE